MDDVLVAQWAARAGGKSRALLALVETLSHSFDVTVVTGIQSYDIDRLHTHHGFFPDCTWQTVDWRDGSRGEIFHGAIEDHDPDVVISFESILNGHLNGIDGRPTVGYLRTQQAFYADEFWAPSQQVADRFNEAFEAREMDVRCRPMYPIWYLDEECEWGGDRPIDLLVHHRKARDAISDLGSTYNVLLAGSFTYFELREMYRRSKAFLFPRPDRFEPLGLMGIEAAAHGCDLILPTNCGVSEIYPERAFEDPSEAVDTVLSLETPKWCIPDSPTDPVERVTHLIEQYE